MVSGRAVPMVGFDTEFSTVDGERVIASYQFCVVDPQDSSVMVQIVILPLSGRRIRLSTALYEVWRSARLWEHPAVLAKGVGEDGVPAEMVSGPGDAVVRVFRDKIYNHGSVPFTLVSHYGSADMTTFWDGRGEPDVLTHLTSAAGGLVTLQPFRVPRLIGRRRCVPFMLSVIDTMAQAPAGQKTLAALGMSCGVPKLEVPGDWISRMHAYRQAFQPVATDDEHVLDTPVGQIRAHRCPECGAFIISDPQSQDVLDAVDVDANSHVAGFVDHAVTVTDFDS